MAFGRRTLLDAVAAALVGLLVFAAFGHAFLNYDSFYALVWGDQLMGGDKPDFEAPVAPTQHPLAVAVGALVSPLGDAAEDVLLALVILSMGFVAVGLFRLGQETFAWPVGLLAAAIFLTRVPPLNFGIRGYVDLPTIALIVWAAVLEVRRPRRGAAVLVLLGLAGLLRPEAWLLAGVYWLWLIAGPEGLRPRLDARALRLGLLAAAAPLIWALTDLLLTGDPLWSLHGTSDLAADLGRPRGLDDVPSIMPRRLGEIMRLPELLAATIGFGLALAWFRRRAAVPAAILVLNGVAFLVLAVGGLSLLGRYLFLAGAMLSVFAAIAALGWTALDRDDPRRRTWMLGGATILVAFAVFAPAQAGRLGDLRDDIADRDRVAADLHDLTKDIGSNRTEHCSPILVPNHRPVPNLAYWTGLGPQHILSAATEEGRESAGGLFIGPATPEAARLSVLDPRDRSAPATPPKDFREADRNRSWVLYVRCEL